MGSSVLISFHFAGHLKSKKMDLKITITFAVVCIVCGIDAKSINNDAANIPVDEISSANTNNELQHDVNSEKIADEDINNIIVDRQEDDGTKDNDEEEND